MEVVFTTLDEHVQTGTQAQIRGLEPIFHLRLYVIRNLREPPDIPVRWRPPQGYLHYQALYRGLHEFLRLPPVYTKLPNAVRYLRKLRACYHPSNTLQKHRILWTQAWIEALADPDDSDAETVVCSE
jgi:hypothetical protein